MKGSGIPVEIADPRVFAAFGESDLDRREIAR
jgi:hypothetical protein